MGCWQSKDTIGKETSISRFEDTLTDLDIQNIIDSYPKDIIFSLKFESDKFIYNIFKNIDNVSINKVNKKIMFIKCEPEPTETCCICLEKMEDDCIQLNICSHKLHQKCAEMTLNKLGESCPLCRISIDHEYIDNYYQSQSNSSYDSTDYND